MPTFWRFHINLLVSIRADACRLIVLLAIYIGTIIKPSITPLNRSSTFLVDKVPVKASVWTMPGAFVLKKIRTLLRSKLLQIPEMTGK